MPRTFLFNLFAIEFLMSRSVTTHQVKAGISWTISAKLSFLFSQIWHSWPSANENKFKKPYFRCPSVLYQFFCKVKKCLTRSYFKRHLEKFRSYIGRYSCIRDLGNCASLCITNREFRFIFIVFGYLQFLEFYPIFQKLTSII